MQAKPMKRKMILLVLAAVFLLAASCSMSDTERQKAGDLVSEQKGYFAEQAVRQYGQDARVKNIRAETRTIYNPLFGIPAERKTTGNLAGDITAGKKTFRGVYSSETGEIYSDKNYEDILRSAKAFSGIPDSQVLDVTLTDAAYEKYYLPDEITTFENMLENQYFMLVHIYTTAGLRSLTREDFAALYRFYQKYEDSAGSMVLIQLKGGEKLAELQRDVNNITFEYEDHHGKVYDNDENTYVDAFEKFDIVSSLYIDETKFIYNN